MIYKTPHETKIIAIITDIINLNQRNKNTEKLFLGKQLLIFTRFSVWSYKWIGKKVEYRINCLLYLQ